ncbi:YdcF family protein [Rhodanobacter sp. B05]|uniref:YdcF family protein n=1 Tax=Rhodanobacter sp. B05 TaxID=1945859 RepID=UPI0020C2EE86|nr:YdcF family protein [Rhodanobacter sp. B05]
MAPIVAQFASSGKPSDPRQGLLARRMGYAALLAAVVSIMIFSVLALLILLGCLARWRGMRWLSVGAGALAVLLFLLTGCGVLPRVLLQRLESPYALRPALDWAPHNAIVLLTGDSVYVPHDKVEPSMSAYGRITEAAVLYRDCRQAQVACKLLVSGGDPSHMDTTLAASYGAVLGQLGVPAEDLILETRSNTTWQNAQFSRPLLARLDAPRVWLVSSAWHLRRGVLYFGHFGIVATPVRADYLRGQLIGWPSASNFVLADIALHEYLGIARYRVYNLLGWNAPGLPPLPQSAAADAVTKR